MADENTPESCPTDARADLLASVNEMADGKISGSCPTDVGKKDENELPLIEYCFRNWRSSGTDNDDQEHSKHAMITTGAKVMDALLDGYHQTYKEFHADFTKTFFRNARESVLTFSDEDIPTLNKFWDRWRAFLMNEQSLLMLHGGPIKDDPAEEKATKAQWFYFHGLFVYIKACNILHQTVDGRAIVPTGVTWVGSGPFSSYRRRMRAFAEE